MTKTTGLTNIEIIIIVILVSIIAILILPRFLTYNSYTEDNILAKDTIAYIYSGYNSCKLDKKCTTVHELINYIQHEPVKENELKLINNVSLRYNDTDSLSDGTSFAVIFPKKKQTFTIYVSKNGELSHKAFSDTDGIGGATIQETMNPFK